MPTIKPIDAKWLNQVREAIDRSGAPHRRSASSPVAPRRHRQLRARRTVGRHRFGAQRREDGVRRMRRELSHERAGIHSNCVGETEFVAQIAADSAKGGRGKAVISAIVAHADLTQGAVLEEVLSAHEDAGQRIVPRHSTRRRARPIPGRSDDRRPCAGRFVFAQGLSRRCENVGPSRLHVRHVALPSSERRVRGTGARRAGYHDGARPLRHAARRRPLSRSA